MSRNGEGLSLLSSKTSYGSDGVVAAAPQSPANLIEQKQPAPVIAAAPKPPQYPKKLIEVGIGDSDDGCGLLRKRHDEWSQQESTACMFWMCGLNTENLDNHCLRSLAGVLCCYMPARCFTATLCCIPDNVWRVVNCCGLFCDVQRDIARNGANQDKHSSILCGSCNEDELTTYENYGYAALANKGDYSSR